MNQYPKISKPSNPKQLKFDDLGLYLPLPQKPVMPSPPALNNQSETGCIVLIIAVIFFFTLPALFLIGAIVYFLFFWKDSTSPNSGSSASNLKKQEYEERLLRYRNIELPNWEREVERLKYQQQESWLQNPKNIDDIVRYFGWRILSSNEIEEKYVGKGERTLCQALSPTGLWAVHQVKIETYYTADIFAYNPTTGYSCVVEVDGRHHWEDLNQIDNDNMRISSLNSKGISVIRFINHQAQDNPGDCAREVKWLLS